MVKRYALEVELEEHEARLRHVFNTAYEGIWFIDHDSKTTYVNQRMAEMLGYTQGEMLGRSLFEFIYAVDRPAIEENLLQRQRGIRGQYDLRYRHKDGTTIWTLICTQPIIDEHDEFQGVLGMHTDITARKAAEERASTLAAIVESCSDAVASVGVDGRISMWNRAFEHLTGRRSDTLFNRNLAEVFELHASEAWNASIEQLRHGATRQEIETTVRSTSGAVQTVALTLSPVHDSGAGLECIGLIARDITHQRREQETLRITQKHEAVGRLAAGIAHDFNNALAVIIGRATLLARAHDAPPSRIQSSLQAITTAARQAQELVHKLLALSQKQLLDPCLVLTNAFLEESADSIREILGDAVELSLNLALPESSVSIDPASMRGVLEVLAQNARDALPEGGNVTITTRVEPDLSPRVGFRDIPLDATANSHAVVIRFADNGSGIEESNLPHIFEPFFTTRPHGLRSGLGLAIATGTVAQNGGHLHISSNTGIGTVAEIWLPVHQATHTPTETNRQSRPIRPCRILLVDDDPMVRQTIAEMLTASEHEVVEVCGPFQAIDLVRNPENKFDVVVSDIKMPDMNGLQMMERIREIRPHLHPVYVSAHGDEPELTRQLRTHKVGFVPKPVEPEALSQAIALLLEETRHPSA